MAKVQLVSWICLALSLGCLTRSSNTAQLIDDLGGADLERAVAAATQLSQARASSAIPALLVATTAPDRRLADAAANALVQMGPAALEAIARSADRELLQAPWLSRFGDAAPIALAEELTKTRNTERWITLATSLGLMQARAAAALPILEKFATEQTNPARRTYIEAQIALIEGGESALARLAAESSIELAKAQARLADAEAVYAAEAHAMADKYINPRVRFEGPKVQAIVAEFKHDLDAALPTLAKMLGGGPDDRAIAIVALGTLADGRSQHTARVTPLLRNALKDAEEAIRVIAAVVLIRLGDRLSSIPVLEAQLADPSDPGSFLYAVSGLAEARHKVTGAAQLAQLTSVLRDADGLPPSVVPMACLVLINSGKPAVVIPVAVGLLESKDQRKMGVALLWKIGAAASHTRPIVEAARASETDEETRTMLDMTIASFGAARR